MSGLPTSFAFSPDVPFRLVLFGDETPGTDTCSQPIDAGAAEKSDVSGCETDSKSQEAGADADEFSDMTESPGDEVQKSGVEGKARSVTDEFGHQDNCLISSIEQVGQWLDKVELGEYKNAFRFNKIDGEMLQRLTDQDLADDFGMGIKYHRWKLMKERAQLRSMPS